MSTSYKIVKIGYMGQEYYALRQYLFKCIPLPWYLDLKDRPFNHSIKNQHFKDCVTQDLSYVEDIIAPEPVYKNLGVVDIKVEKTDKLIDPS